MPFALQHLQLVSTTAIYAALCAIIIVALSAHTSRVRLKHQVFLGDGGVRELQEAIRAHANAMETVPLALLLLLIAELSGAPAGVLHAFGATFVAARVGHAHGMLGRIKVTHTAGASLTLLVTLGLAGYALWLRLAT